MFMVDAECKIEMLVDRVNNEDQVLWVENG